jgi:hypothetical protein
MHFEPTWRAFANRDSELHGNDIAHLVSSGVRSNR